MFYKKSSNPDHSHVLRHPTGETSLEERQRTLEADTHQTVVGVCSSAFGRQIVFPSFQLIKLSLSSSALPGSLLIKVLILLDSFEAQRFINHRKNIVC